MSGFPQRVVIEMPPFHRRLIECGLEMCARYGLLLAGGSAMKAHGLVDRSGQDPDFVTTHPLPVERLATRIADGYRAQGFMVDAAPGDHWFARLLITDRLSGESCEVDLMKATLTVTPTVIDACPVVGFDDAIGLKTRAVHDRGIARDLIDAAALEDVYSFERLESLCRSHEPDFSLERLASRLEAAESRHEAEFEDHGLDHHEILRVKRFAAAWAQDINLRLLEETPYEDALEDL